MLRRPLAWWYWLVTVILLSAAVLGVRQALLGAILVTGVQLLQVLLRSGGAISFPVQVRACYLALLVLGAWPPFAFVHWIQVVGTWAVVLTDYCFLARCLSLLPWNDRTALSWTRVARTFFSPPTPGSILQGSARR